MKPILRDWRVGHPISNRQRTWHCKLNGYISLSYAATRKGNHSWLDSFVEEDWQPVNAYKTRIRIHRSIATKYFLYNAHDKVTTGRSQQRQRNIHIYKQSRNSECVIRLFCSNLAHQYLIVVINMNFRIMVKIRLPMNDRLNQAVRL